MGTSTIMYLFYRAMMAMSHFLEYFGGSIGIHLQVGMLSGRLGGNIYIYICMYIPSTSSALEKFRREPGRGGEKPSLTKTSPLRREGGPWVAVSRLEE